MRLFQEKIKLSKKSIVRIVSDAAIARQDLGEGRLIPLLIIDVVERPDIINLVNAHEHLPPGDMTCLWGQPQGEKNKISLIIDFIRRSNLLLTFLDQYRQLHYFHYLLYYLE